jgi:glycosyltransferase involved in cell wall biosynthesis
VPLVSVVIPAYNAAQFLGDTIQSAKDQTLQDLEIIVVDDGSRDQTAAVAESYPGVRCIRQANQGVSAARNTGVNAASGEFIAFLDADDIWHRDKLRQQIDGMLAQPDIDISRTHLCETPWTPAEDLEICQRTLISVDEALEITFLRPYFATSTVIVRHRAFDRVGGFDTALRVAEDINFFLRVVADAPRVLVCRNNLLFKRPVPDSLGANSIEGYVQLLAVYEKLLRDIPRLRENLGDAVVQRAFGRLHLALARSLQWDQQGPEARAELQNARRLLGWDSDMTEIWLRSWAPGWLLNSLGKLKRVI